MKKILKKMKKYRHISSVDEVARRYFVMNGFDGILTVLGIVIGTYIANVRDPTIIIITTISTCIAIGISGFSGTFMSEKAERTRHIKSLEKKMLTKFNNSIINESASFACFFSAFIAAISPFTFAIIILIPMFLTILGLVSYIIAFYSLIGISLLTLFMLGVFLGKVSKENIIIWGSKMFLIGLLTTLLLFFIGSSFSL
jgi:predicted membrane protein (TIGR00267 family)